ncbi:hypothetical protein G3N58_15200 [Paraburkholderia sp. Ac-20342]|uniref:hypothetical protein n=1 Tax=Paraburkholderia sp. Ac-20342 TaxID=2703889 RepID=UPI001980D95C|nr:hypothetical protein [Paraburkholderia sp. Ac-20342]MBN3848167.1 hypothetical protein [Paraburkholderia sp. Ac-20342]
MSAILTLSGSAAIAVATARQRRTDAIWNLAVLPTQKLILLALSEKADDADTCQLTVDYLVNRANVTRMTVFVSLNALERAGLLTRAGRPGSATTYTLTVTGGARQ